MRDIFIEIWTTVKHNRLRTALTGFSVAWGIFILIVLLGAGNGLINGIMGNRMNVLTNSMSIYGGQTSKAYDGLGEGRNVELNDKDLAITRHGFESNIDDVGAEIEKSGLNIAYGDNYSTGVSVNGVYPNDVDINKRDMLCGRFLNALDIEQRRKTIVVSQGLAKELMPHAPLNLNGRVVKVDNLAFTVVGIYDSDKRRHGDNHRSEHKYNLNSTYLVGPLHIYRITFLMADYYQTDQFLYSYITNNCYPPLYWLHSLQPPLLAHYWHWQLVARASLCLSLSSEVEQQLQAQC